MRVDSTAVTAAARIAARISPIHGAIASSGPSIVPRPTVLRRKKKTPLRVAARATPAGIHQIGRGSNFWRPRK